MVYEDACRSITGTIGVQHEGGVREDWHNKGEGGAEDNKPAGTNMPEDIDTIHIERGLREHHPSLQNNPHQA